MSGESRGSVRWVAGAMTGTSLDGLDVALVRVSGRGRGMSAEVAGHQSRSLGPMRETLASLAAHEAHEPAVYLRAARWLGEAYAEAVAGLCEAHLPAGERLELVAGHGQTICHLPGEGMSWQLFDPWPLVRRLGTAVVYDLRQADLIAGGAGAPITPIADPILYGKRVSAVVNLGGICNYTAWAGEAIAAGDVTACNLLLDGLVQRLVKGARYDRDGELARAGRAEAVLVERIGRAVDAAAGEPGATLGREQFNADFFDRLLAEVGRNVEVSDLLASAADVVAQRVVDGVSAGREQLGPATAAGDVVLAGGGARNAALVEAIKQASGEQGGRWVVSDELGIACEAREAAALAVLGALCDDGVPITLPGVTGSERPGVAGAWAGIRKTNENA